MISALIIMKFLFVVCILSNIHLMSYYIYPVLPAVELLQLNLDMHLIVQVTISLYFIIRHVLWNLDNVNTMFLMVYCLLDPLLIHCWYWVVSGFICVDYYMFKCILIYFISTKLIIGGTAMLQLIKIQIVLYIEYLLTK